METLALHDLHSRAGASFGNLNGREIVSGYAGKDAYAAAHSSAALVDLSARQWLRITGEDRHSFLHGMCTNDIKGLPEGHTTYAALLTAKGAMVCDVRVWRRKEDLLLEVEPGLGPKVKDFLAKYLISEDAELEDVTEAWGLFGLYGPSAGAVLKAALGVEAPGENHFISASVSDPRGEGGVAPPLARVREVLVSGVALPLGGIELAAPVEGLATLDARLMEAGGPLGLERMGFDTLEVLRVEAGVPRYGQDMEDKTIPLEANLERALHYNKGCYIGQEVIARATFRGHMNRKLMGLLLGDGTPPLLSELRSGDKKVGWITSVVHSPAVRQNVALAYVHRDYLAPGTRLEVASGGTAEVQPLPFVKPS